MKVFKLFLFCTICFSNASSAQQQKPNIIFLLADDLGVGDLGCYGQQKIATPNIDAFAKQGMLFTQFYAGSTVCAPSRCSFMTGLHTGHTPIRGNKSIQPEGQFPMPANTVVLSKVLQQNGYITANFGKWGLGGIGSDGVPLKQGFDIFYGYNCQALAHNYYPNYLWDNNTKINLPNQNKDSVYSADLIHQKAMQFLQTKHTKPFFLFLSYTLPHAGLNLPRDSVYWKYVQQFNEPPLQPKIGKKQYESGPFEPYPHAAYAAMVTKLDSYVKELSNLLQQKGLDKNTLIVFTSDNGPHSEGGNDPEFFNSNGMYSGKKRDLTDGGIHTPFIAVWKGKIKPNTVSNHIAAVWDVFATFLDAAKINNNYRLDGISFMPTLTNKKTQTQHPFLYWEFHEEGGKQAVRWGKWKGIQLNVSTQNPSAIQLYDVTNDPEEKNNLAAANPEIVQQIATFITQSHVSNKDWPLYHQEKQQQKPAN